MAADANTLLSAAHIPYIQHAIYRCYRTAIHYLPQPSVPFSTLGFPAYTRLTARGSGKGQAVPVYAAKAYGGTDVYLYWTLHYGGEWSNST